MEINLNELWSEYELIDCGNSRKLERFGDIVLIRPDVSADEESCIPYEEWRKMADAEFVEISKNTGKWEVFKTVPETWSIKYSSKLMNIVAELSLSNTKQIGVFPEQVINWQFMEKMNPVYPNMRFLNLFGYTGLSSVAAAPLAKKVTHIDSIKKVVDQTKKNALNSGYENLRCISEDALKFVNREIKRGKKYHGVILDPPTIGTGANKEKWILEDMIDDLLAGIAQILHDQSYIIMNLYSRSMNEKFIHRLFLTYFPKHKLTLCEKLTGLATSGNSIDHGYFVRLVKK
jgi:23S rRNA (cytosine1962-C5)-methyltransferase